MPAREARKTRDTKQAEKMILLTGEIAVRQHVCELVLGFNIYDFGLWGPN